MTHTITLAGQSVDLVRPKSPSLAAAVFEAATDSHIMSMGAAIGVCWPPKLDWPGEGNPGLLQRYRYNASEYGRVVFDSLRNAQIPYEEIVAAGVIARNICGEMILTEQEVAEAADFSADGEGGSTQRS